MPRVKNLRGAPMGAPCGPGHGGRGGPLSSSRGLDIEEAGSGNGEMEGRAGEGEGA